MTEQRYRLEFVVKVQDWQDVVDIFKKDLGIDSGKQDVSDRKVNGFFIVQVWINEDKLNSDFYDKINKSEYIALSYDPSAKKIRDDILDRLCIIEHDLRKLLLNISDVVEDYFKIYDKTTVAKIYKNNREVVRKGNVNPITSYLTLEDEINIFSIDLSPWNNKPLTANDLLEIFNDAETLDQVKEKLRLETESHTIWDTVNKYILKNDKSWLDILPKLNELKDIRNKAAHFRVVTASDLDRTKALSKEIIDIITPRRKSTAQDLSELRRSIDRQMRAISELTTPMTDTIRSISESYMVNLQPLADSILSAQKSFFDAANINSSIFNSMIASQTIARQFIENSGINSLITTQHSALSSIVPNINFPTINLSQYTIDSMLRAQNIIGDLDIPSGTNDDTYADDKSKSSDDVSKKDDEVSIPPDDSEKDKK